MFLLRKVKRFISSSTLVCIAVLGICWTSYSLTFTQGNATRYQLRGNGSQTRLPAIQQSNKLAVPPTTNRNGTMENRRSAVLTMCRQNITYKRPYRDHMILNKNKHFIFCKATKTGSTFWGRLLLQVDRHVIGSPYKIKPQIGPVNIVPTIREWRNFEAVLKSSTKFIVARNPLERLYSAYVDKVYSPNPYYWDSLGKYVVRNFRRPSESTCGHDVTFTEFLKYAVNAETTGRHRDVHVASLWETCSPCHVNYDIIGKMETFKDDTTYILEKLNLGMYIDVLRNVSADAVNDALYDTAQAFVDMRTEALKCISEHQIVDRIWTKLKARGYVAADMPLPMNLYNKSEETVFKIFKDVYSESIIKLGRHGLKQQQKAIYLETLRKIPTETLTQIGNAYYRDFRMFGYDHKVDEKLHNSKNSEFAVSDSFF
ncbi:carbohydrate sulfotransferase 11-like [Pecten maximus]|uniref:carbohydrate sulfotransferase 11-like n=1 Tax=Pecten maximus TaxID=6579 RepID=UPI00145913D0|nr:carbohydrate sulfotransferase 11-like [Pecten maximus]